MKTSNATITKTAEACQPAGTLPIEYSVDLQRPVSRRKLGIMLGIDVRRLKAYESHGIISGIPLAGYTNHRYIPSQVLEQLTDYSRSEHANTQQRIQTARNYLMNERKAGMKYGKKKTTM